MTSVAARASARNAAADALSLSVVIESTAAWLTSPVALCLLFKMPTPMGLVRVMGWPAVAASLRISFAGSAVPVTAIP